MATIKTINETDLITDSRADINDNFSALNSDKIETSYLDTDNTLAANSDVKIPSQKAVKAYVDAGGNVNASTTTKGIVEEATQAEVDAGTTTGATGAKLFVTPDKLETRFSAKLKFGGTGADGALSVTSGTTTIDLANTDVVIKNYTSINVAAGATLAFQNPHTNGTRIILKSQGAVTIAGTINASGMGAAGGAQVGSSDGKIGSLPHGLIAADLLYGGAGQYPATDGVGAAGAGMTLTGIYGITKYVPISRFVHVIPGAGGGSGAAGEADGGTGGYGGAGGNGGGAILIECAGALNFTGTINTSGANGSAGGNGVAGGNSTCGGGGGGGGSAGMCLVLYNTLTANSGTITATGGNGGNGGSKPVVIVAGNTGSGGGGAGSYSGAGGAGGSAGDNGSNAASNGAGGGGGGGSRTGSGTSTGGTGGSSIGGLVLQNTMFT
jgi:hypothetical protein